MSKEQATEIVTIIQTEPSKPQTTEYVTIKTEVSEPVEARDIEIVVVDSSDN